MKKYLDFRKQIKYEELKKVAEIIQNGGIGVFPTETVYGIGANCFDEDAIRRIYEVKERPYTKPLSVLVSDMKMIENVAKDITATEYKLMDAFFPGPFTIILKKKDNVPNILTANSDTIGVRMPDNEIALKLVEYTKNPIATPSANITGKASGTNIETIMKDFKGKIDFVIDGGESKIGIGSTIVKVVDGVPNILREGRITKADIDKVLKNNV